MRGAGFEGRGEPRGGRRKCCAPGVPPGRRLRYFGCGLEGRLAPFERRKSDGNYRAKTVLPVFSPKKQGVRKNGGPGEIVDTLLCFEYRCQEGYYEMRGGKWGLRKRSRT